MASLITDTHPSSTQWRAYIGEATKAQANSYDTGHGQHALTDSLQSTMTYLVTVQHQTNSAGQILDWGDDKGDGVNTQNTTTGHNIYLATSTGYGPTASRTVVVEMAKIPSITVPRALYVEAYTTIQGSSTNVLGTDQCGSDDQPGIRTTLSAGEADQD